MTPRAAVPSAQAGFTLAEMLVSLALLAMASVLMIAGFTASHGAWRRMQARTEAGESVSLAQMRLRSLLEQMVVRARFETATPYVELSGDDRSFTFPSAPLAGEAPGATVDRRLSLSDAGELQLADADARPDVLLRGASRLEIGYYAPPPRPGWRSAWSRQPQPPELIRVRLDFPEGDRRFWPELIVRPAAAVDVQCVVDGDTGQCRGRG